MKFYLYSCMISCILDFIRSYRTSKYRKHVDQKTGNRDSYNKYIFTYISLICIDC